MKAVSFIGLNKYELSKYVYDGKTCETNLFPHAVSSFFKPDKILICLTKESENAPLNNSFFSKDETRERLKNYLDSVIKIHKLSVTGFDDNTYFGQLKRINAEKGLVEPQKVLIKSGENEDELWEIFEKIAGSLDEGDEVVFDITHAFRSIPILAFLVIAFLRETKGIKVHKVIYGAYDARNETTNEVPVFDLTPFLELLDWMTATKQFKDTGNARFLVQLLKQKRDFEQFAEEIGSLSEGLQMLRPIQVLQNAYILPESMYLAKQRISASTQPFAQLIDSISDTYGKFGLDEPEEKENTGERLIKELELAEWYNKNGQIVQAIAIAREWLVSLVCYHFNLNSLQFHNRKAAEELLGGEDYFTFHNGKKIEWQNLPLEESLRTEVRELWRDTPDMKSRGVTGLNLTGLRNDLLHAGYNYYTDNPENIIGKTRLVLEKLRSIAAGHGLIE